MARPKRFELLTPRFVVWCSIQLSYGRFAHRAENRRTSKARDAGHSYRLGCLLASRLAVYEAVSKALAFASFRIAFRVAATAIK